MLTLTSPHCRCSDCARPGDCVRMFWRWRGQARTLPLCARCALARVEAWQAVQTARAIVRSAVPR